VVFFLRVIRLCFVSLMHWCSRSPHGIVETAPQRLLNGWVFFLKVWLRLVWLYV